MRNTIGIRVSGVDNVVSLQEFLKAASNLMDLISEVDASTSPSRVQTADWKLKRLTYSSPAELVAEGVVREDQPDNRDTIVDTIFSGVTILKLSNERPRGFSDKALEKARDLSGILSDGVARIELISDDTSVEFGLEMLGNVAKILRPGREVFGSIEGHLETLNSHDGFKFAIYEPVLLRRIRCELMDKDDAQLRRRVYELYEHNVLATGLLTTNIRGEAQAVKIKDIVDRDRKQRLKDASEITGIYAVRSDTDPVDYVRSLRQ